MLFLLLLVVGLAIVLSIASRTVTDIRITTTSDESSRAYFAAEAGIEEALKRLKSGDPVPELTLNFPDLQTTATTRLKPSGANIEIYIVPFDVRKDDVAQVNMLPDPDDYTKGWKGKDISVYWGGEPLNLSDEDPAIEVTIVYTPPPSGICGSLGSIFCLTKFIFDPFAARPASPPNYNFCALQPADIDNPVTLKDSLNPAFEKTFYFRAGININDGNPTCPNNVGVPAGSHPVFLRLRPLFNKNKPMPIAVRAEDLPPGLPGQFQTIESTGRTVSGVTRKIQVKATLPALPAIFDFVLFSGGDGPLKKE